MKKFLLALLGVLLPFPVFAGVSLTSYGFDCSGYLYCGSSDVVTTMTTRIVSGVGMFIFALAVVVFLYGALRMVTSQGDEGKEAGKKALIYASVGLAAALLVTGIIQFVYGYIYYLGG